MLRLLKKDLVVTVDGNTYHFSITDRDSSVDIVDSSNGYIVYVTYRQETMASMAIGDILEQTGKTKHFHFRWYDNINYPDYSK
ncbi:protein of unknown function [Xenorhabdus doucetiae]|uniref:DUF7823 domain-containing protein n=1 Tax=Xenorhabdus doucetiae TaxID=351671 RepID=A0A068QMX1_9GAMM|nr:hypothetical protein LY16_03380 [Xenorhabdus doucetiae]CDG16252.1 protein of unknown function [Xenorhabdus doucetiae]